MKHPLNNLRDLKAGDEVVLIPHSNNARRGAQYETRVIAKVGRELIHLDAPAWTRSRGFDRDDGRERSDWPAYIRTKAFHAYEEDRVALVSRGHELTRRHGWIDALNTGQLTRLIALLSEAA